MPDPLPDPIEKHQPPKNRELDHPQEIVGDLGDEDTVIYREGAEPSLDIALNIFETISKKQIHHPQDSSLLNRELRSFSSEYGDGVICSANNIYPGKTFNEDAVGVQEMMSDSLERPILDICVGDGVGGSAVGHLVSDACVRRRLEISQESYIPQVALQRAIQELALSFAQDDFLTDNDRKKFNNCGAASTYAGGRIVQPGLLNADWSGDAEVGVIRDGEIVFASTRHTMLQDIFHSQIENIPLYKTVKEQRDALWHACVREHYQLHGTDQNMLYSVLSDSLVTQSIYIQGNECHTEGIESREGIEIRPNDLVIFCSDGIFRGPKVDLSTFEWDLSELITLNSVAEEYHDFDDLEAFAVHLVDKARAAGSQDDATIALLKVK